MLKTIFSWFTKSKPSENALPPQVAQEVAPYKVDAPVTAPPVVEPKKVTKADAPAARPKKASATKPTVPVKSKSKTKKPNSP